VPLPHRNAVTPVVAARSGSGGAARTELSLIVAVDVIYPGLSRSVEDMVNALGHAPVEVIIAARKPWKAAPRGVAVVALDSPSRGDRFDRASEAAHGAILAFIDDRVRLPAKWVERVLTMFADPNVAVAGGPILPRSGRLGEHVSAAIMDRHIGLTAAAAHLSRRGTARSVRELAGSNLVIRTDVFEAVGGFQSPSVGGEAVRICYKVRRLLGRQIRFDPSLAVHATVPRFPWPFLGTMMSYGRVRGDLARRLREVAPLFPYGLPAAVVFLLALELSMLPLRWWVAAKIGLALLLIVYAIQAAVVLASRSPFRARLIAALVLPFVPLSYGLGFIRGYLGPNLGEVSPRRERSRPLRVLIINWRDVTHPWSGGAEIYMHEMGRRWAADGLEVGWLSQCYKGSARVEVIDGIRVHRVGGRYTLYPMVVFAYLFRLRGRYDVIVDCENGIPFFTPLFAGVPKVLVVHHVHQEIFQRELRPPMRWLAMWLEGWLVPRVYKRTPIVAVSKSTRDDLVHHGFDPTRISIIHNGVRPVNTTTTPRANRPTIICTGRLKSQKCIDILIRAMPKVLEDYPDADLHIVGQGPDRARLERVAWSLGLLNKVRFHGYLPDYARDHLAARAWVAVCPSAFEGWGVVCVEAGARGLPVIASNVPGLRDSVLDGETGILVPHGDPNAIATALDQLFRDPELRERMGESGRRWAQRHTWDRSAQQMIEVLQGLMPNQRVELSGRAAASSGGTLAVEEPETANAR
jgi:glycosyltransferase involved in cell wall biosynthesis